MIKEMLDAGVRGYVLKSDAARDLFVAVEALQHGKTFFHFQGSGNDPERPFEEK
jgi:DNA-binding NarL/FixJ family response regulator